MNKVLEVFLLSLALAGLYSTIPKSMARTDNVRAEQAVVVADGADPMPLCRRLHCTQ